MSSRIKTSISAIVNMFDVNGQWLPKGNYYFCIDEITDSTAKGELIERTFNAEYEFKLNDLVNMMSIAQARLARRANIIDVNMPSCASPTTSPVSTPHELSFRRIRDYVNEPKRRVDEEPEHDTCTICLENISDSENETLVCNHSFHNICINRWLSTNTNCPVCRRFIRNRAVELPNIHNYNRQSIPPSTTNTIPVYHRRRNIRHSYVQITPVVSRNNHVVIPRSPLITEYPTRPVSSLRQREYNRIYSSSNSILR